MPIPLSGNRIIIKEFMKSHNRLIEWDFNALLYTAMQCRKIAYKKGVHYTKARPYKELFANIETSMTTLNFNSIVYELINFIEYYNLQKSKKKKFGEIKLERDSYEFTYKVNYEDSTYKLISQ
jgi:hypothetical protein